MMAAKFSKCRGFLDPVDEYQTTRDSLKSVCEVLGSACELSPSMTSRMTSEEEYLQERLVFLPEHFKVALNEITMAPRDRTSTIVSRIEARKWGELFKEKLGNPYTMEGTRYLLSEKLKPMDLFPVRANMYSLYLFLANVRFWLEFLDSIYNRDDYVVIRKALTELILTSLDSYFRGAEELPDSWRFAHELSKRVEGKSDLSDFISVSLIPAFYAGFQRTVPKPTLIASVSGDQKVLVAYNPVSKDERNQSKFFILQKKDPNLLEIVRRLSEKRELR